MSYVNYLDTLAPLAFGHQTKRSAEHKSKVYTLHKPDFPKLPTLLVTKVRPSDEALRVRKRSKASFSNLAPTE